MEHILFDPADPKTALTQLPHAPAVFALYGAEAHAEPYIGRTPNLRSRLERLLQPSEKHPRRLQLAGRVRRIEYCLSGSEFESLLAQFSLLEKVFGAKALERMHLRMPAFVRFLGGNPYPRVTVTNRPSLREADWSYGPFPSRVAAERYAEEALKLFLLRRCTDDLAPDPSHPGCVYSEMKMCLAPCYKGCTDDRYAEESAAVQDFFRTRGESRLIPLRAEREQASADLAFESAAQIHAQIQRVESVRALASELVHPLSQLRALILQPGAQPNEIALFLFENGSLRGPVSFSTLGMRIQNEQSGSSSLFAQPMAIEPVPEEQGAEAQGIWNREQGLETGQAEHSESMKDGGFSRQIGKPEPEEANSDGLQPIPSSHAGISPSPKLSRSLLESRMESALAQLAEDRSAPPSAIARQAHLALLKRWYYRPEMKRVGEICFPDADVHWPIKSILRSVGRVAGKAVLGNAPPAGAS